MSILVLLEPELVRTSAVGATTDYVEGVRAVHAARAAPESAEEPGDLTLCGLGTSRMRRSPYRPPGADALWYPPEWSTRVCPHCDRAARAVRERPGPEAGRP
ncbi:hypothetical protein ACIQ9P_36205 [Kitasatospora sp. NPDC094019]|uniref:hypothetical protein n=1 Tax=Kitasatospora sp. NPDC094019 TaxID=3364091 RepID=UPI00380DB765